MSEWTKRLKRDVVGMLVGSNDPAISYLARRDLLGERLSGAGALWNLPDCSRVVARQRADGSWRYPGGNQVVRSQTNYDQLETYRQFGILVYRFELNRRHPAIDRAARFLLSFQTDAGDFRGIYGSQFTPNYSAAITELLVKAGYGSSPEVARSMRWLLSMRQDDGGWAIPLRTRGKSLDVTTMRRPPLEPDRSKPSSHLITGIVLRAFAAHDRWRRSEEARQAGELLKTRFFRSDRYPDHRPASHWLTFSYPFWWTDLVSALDSLLCLGFTHSDPDVRRGLNWFIEHQETDGMWQKGHNRPKGPHADEWVALAVCRLLTNV